MDMLYHNIAHVAIRAISDLFLTMITASSLSRLAPL